MFERYDEKARRIIFFGRYEASQVGSPSIESEHLLLGLLHDAPAITFKLMSGSAHDEIVKEIEKYSVKRHPIATSVDLPLSNECKRILAYAAEEAERLSHEQIRPEHLLLGMLRENRCFASQLLRNHGVEIDNAREFALLNASRISHGPKPLHASAGTPIEFRTKTALLAGSVYPGVVPRAGESVTFGSAGNERSYTVRDVKYVFEDAPGPLRTRLSKIVISVEES
jgi:ATP-dependent Clp protease ATP-binding subunit ClpA